MSPPSDDARHSSSEEENETLPVEKNRGGRKPWATKEQVTWLKQYVDDFRATQEEAREKKKRILIFDDFWGPLFEKWFDNWPEPIPADSSETLDSAMAERQKVSFSFILK
jgi:hypothetical protein